MLSIAPPDLQIPLLRIAPVYNCANNAEARNAYGSAAMEIVCSALELNPIRINGNFDVCFDAKKGDDFYEIKSARRGGKITLYDWRMKKEACGVKSFYAILVHNLIGCREDVLSKMILSSPMIIRVKTDLLHALAFSSPLHKIKDGASKYAGYSRAGYADGYRSLSIKSVQSIPHEIIFPQFNHQQEPLLK
jgi:hypothetical protein